MEVLFYLATLYTGRSDNDSQRVQGTQKGRKRFLAR
jgi:hypothetical protein